MPLNAAHLVESTFKSVERQPANCVHAYNLSVYLLDRESFHSSRATGLINSRRISCAARRAKKTLSRTRPVKFLNSRLITFPSRFRFTARNQDFPESARKESFLFASVLRRSKVNVTTIGNPPHLCVPWIYSHNREPSFSMNFVGI